MKIYKVFYSEKTGRNLTISFSRSNYTAWGIVLPKRHGCCTGWGIHFGKLHIVSLTPISNTEK